MWGGGFFVFGTRGGALIRYVELALRLIAGVGGAALFINGVLIFPFVYSNGKYMQLAIGAVLLLYAVLYRPLMRLTQAGLPRILRWAAYAGILFMAATILVIAVIGQTNTVTYREDAIIVLGGSLRGERVSRVVAERLDAAADYLLRNENAVVVLSGGQGADEAITEAEAMRRYLLAKDIPDERMLKEERSTSTAENFRFSKKLLDATFGGVYTVAYATNDFHAYRAGQLAKLAGLNATRLSGDTPAYLAASSYIREFFAVIKLWLFKT